jgi:hypothetical protein
MDIATAIQKKLDSSAQAANLVHEVSSRLASTLGAEIQRTFPHMDGLAALSRAQEMTQDCVDFYRTGAGNLLPMNEPTLGKFLAATETQMSQALLEKFHVLYAVSKNARAQYSQTYNAMQSRP